MESNEFQRAFEQSGDVLILCDASERVLAASDAAAQLLGCSPGTLVGKPFPSVLPRRFRRLRDGSLLGQLLARPKTTQWTPVQATMLRANGVEREVSLKARRLDGEPPRILVALSPPPETVELDTPELASSSDGGPHLPAGDRLYRVVVENAPLGIFHFDRRGEITACNSRIVEILGTSRTATVGLRLFTLPDERIVGCVRRTLEGHHAYFEGDYTTTTSGKVAPVRVYFAPTFGERGRVTGGVGIVEDVAEQRRTAEERSAALAQADLVFRAAPVGMAVLDRQLRYVRVNAELAALNGLPPEQHPGKSVREVVPGEPGERIEAILREVLATGTPRVQIETEDLGLHDPRANRAFSASFYPVRTLEGEVIGVGGIIEDISARKQTEAARSELFAQVQEALQARDDFLTIASHELKTPLTALALRLAMLDRALQKGRHIDGETLARARDHLDRLTNLINDLLDASRAENGRLTVQPELTRLEAVVEHTIEAHAFRADGHLVAYRGPGEPLYARVDASRIEQVVANLLENAVKYSPGGGEIAVGLAAHGDVAVLAVTDHGIGIPTDQQARLFDRYFRARNASARSYSGLGLGLYIARDIVERHGGRIWVESEVGRGSTFFVALPLAPRPGSSLEPVASQAEPQPPA